MESDDLTADKNHSQSSLSDPFELLSDEWLKENDAIKPYFQCLDRSIQSYTEARCPEEILSQFELSDEKPLTNDTV